MYIGQDEILKEEKDAEGFTKVSFKPIEKDGEKIELEPKVFSNLILNELKTKEPMDLNYIRDVRCNSCVKGMLEVMLNHNILLENEINYILQKLQISFNENYKQADDKVWGIKGHERGMLDIDKVLKAE